MNCFCWLSVPVASVSGSRPTAHVTCSREIESLPLSVVVAPSRLPNSSTSTRSFLWWEKLTGSVETLDNAYLVRLAGRFSRRVRGYAKAESIPVIDCAPGERKHDIAEEHLKKTTVTQRGIAATKGNSPQRRRDSEVFREKTVLRVSAVNFLLPYECAAKKLYQRRTCTPH